MTLTQKLAAAALPVAALMLAMETAGPDWNPPRTQRSWRATMHPAPVEAPPEAPAGKEPAKPGPGEKPAAGPEKKPEKPVAKKETPPEPKKPEVPEKPAGPPEVEFKVTGLEASSTTAPLTVPAAERLDIQVGSSGAVKIGMNFSDMEMALEALEGRESRGTDLLFLVPNARAPWEPVRDLAVAALERGWNRIALAACTPKDSTRARMVPVAITPAELPEDSDLDPVVVKVLPDQGGRPSFRMNEQTFADKAALADRAKFLHDEFEGFVPGYSGTVETTAWTVDGEGASAGGVLQALDALAGAGVKTVRLAGVRRSK